MGTIDCVRVMWRIATQVAILTLLGSILVFAEPAGACYQPNLTFYPLNGTDFKVGQHSQGGNQYYGTAGVMNTAYPPNPLTYPNAYAGQHVNQALASVDERYQGSVTPGLIHVGWFVGFHQDGGTTRTSATVSAEVFPYSLSPILFVGSGAQASTWYKTQLTGSVPGGNWHYDAWELVAGSWSRLGNGVDLTTSTTESEAFGEASDPGSDQNSRCRYLSNASGGDNSFASLQLFVDNVVWQNWEPAFGRFACAFSEAPYRPDPSLNPTNCTDGSFWIRQYTDFIVGGP